MSKQKYTHLVIILDRSGSMSSIRKDMEGGFNALINKQKEVEGTATLTLAQFDNHYEIVHNNIALADTPDLTLEPRGGTALLDAMGKTLTEERERIKSMDAENSPEKVVCIIITDGDENASSQYNRDRILKMIEDLEAEEDPQWDFVFLGANQDAIKSGGSIGVRASSAMTYDASAIGTQCAFSSLSDNLATYRSASKGVRYAFSEQDRKNQENLTNNNDKFNKAIPTYIPDLNSRTQSS